MDARAASRVSALTNHVVPPLEVRTFTLSARRPTEMGLCTHATLDNEGALRRLNRPKAVASVAHTIF